MADLKKQIMRRVYFIWFMRKVVNATNVKFAIALALLWQFTFYVSVKNVIANLPVMQGDVSASFAFFQSAFENTEVMTMLIGSAIAVTGALISYDFLSRRKFDTQRAFAGV